MDWPVLIGAALEKRHAVIEADAYRMHKYLLPRLALSEPRIEELEEVLGRLPHSYRTFLETCNGWPDVVCGYSLFGRDELLGGGLGEVADQRLQEHGTVDLIAIGASQHESDVFGLHRDDGRVVWLYDEGLVDTFDSFAAFFEELISYIERLPATMIEQTEELRREGHKLPE